MRWIKLTERYPEKAGRYFVYDANGKKRTCLYYPKYKEFTTAVVKWLDEDYATGINIWFRRFLYNVKKIIQNEN